MDSPIVAFFHFMFHEFWLSYTSVNICKLWLQAGEATSGVDAHMEDALKNWRKKDVFAKRFVPFGTTIFSEMTKLADERGAINLAQGFPDFDAPPEILEEAVKALRNGQNQYARSMGHPSFVESISRSIEHHYGLKYDPYSEVVVTSGVTEGIASAFLGLLNPGDEIIFFEPHYDSYPVCASMAGAVSRFCTLRFPAFRVNIDELARCFSDRTRLLFINTPHNPTGKVFSREELEAIATLCIRHDIIVITDEVYEHITYDQAEHIPMASIPGMRERTLTLSGAGKTFSITGWRLGWATGPQNMIAAVQRAHQYVTFAPATPLQAALGSILHSIGDEYYSDLKKGYSERRSLLLDALRKIGFNVSVPEGTYYILADFSGLWDGDDRSFVLHLIERCGVASIPPSPFYSRHPREGKKLVRFAFCKRLETLSSAVKRLRRFVSH
jgi:aspartate/methionine/tyrosine aminotransferase